MNKFSPLLCCLLLTIGVCKAQIFSWYLDGYQRNTPGGQFNNIDNSGIDLKVTGLSQGFHSIPANFVGRSVMTGINDQQSGGVQHTYKFFFSEAVNVEFTIEDINEDSTDNACFRDYLYFSGEPIFSEVKYVKVVGADIVEPSRISNPYNEGIITIRYEKVSNFVILHGRGYGCNPGYIRIDSLIINDNKMPIGLNELGSFNQLTSYVNSNQELVLNGMPINTNVEVQLFNMQGQHLWAAICQTSTKKFDVRMLPTGTYLLLLTSENGDVGTRKISIQHR